MQKMKNFILKNRTRAMLVMGIALASFVAIVPAYAINPYQPAPTTGIQGLAGVFDLLLKVFNVLFWALIVLAAIFIIMAAFAYLTAGGDPENVKKANHRVIYAAVAVVVAVLAKTIPTVVCNFIADPGTVGSCVI